MRECGILMPVASLPGPGGIGCFGKGAYDFVDFLAAAGQQIWQILPLSPTGYGDSPYQSCSAFAGNPYFIDLEELTRQGLLQPKELKDLDWGSDPEQIDYGAQYQNRLKVLRIAFERWRQLRPVPGHSTHRSDDFYAFFLLNQSWLEDYALYMAIKEEQQLKPYQEWPRPLRCRETAALKEFSAAHETELEFWRFVQYEFSCQWQALKRYANQKGVRILGDIPIYVSADSADAWAGGPLFEMDEESRPTRVAGCPPDYFSADGQLWGNPLYDWRYHAQTGYAWWVGRVRHALSLYDLLRIDHFRGFDTYWAIPADAESARVGSWQVGPGMELFRALHQELGQLPIIAEDLGELFDSVRQLLKESGFPGMKVLQFAFGSGGNNEYLPHTYPQGCVVYPGTHDNTTAADWAQHTASPKELAHAVRYLGLNREEGLARGLVRGALASPADLAVIPMADWLGLGAKARINTPGVLGGNWAWRMKADAATPALAQEIHTLCADFGRCEPLPSKKKTTKSTARAEDQTPKKPAKTVKK